MSNVPSLVVLSDRAFTTILYETQKRITTETGGILLGHRRGDFWYVIEVLDSGPNASFSTVTFEYDDVYVNHLAGHVSNLYEIKLEVLGLWHRHPGSFDSFSSTDDVTHKEFAKIHQAGIISALVNIDPRFRFTVYHVTLPLNYARVEYRIGDSEIPEQMLRLKQHSILQESILAENQGRTITGFRNRPTPSTTTSSPSTTTSSQSEAPVSSELYLKQFTPVQHIRNVLTRLVGGVRTGFVVIGNEVIVLADVVVERFANGHNVSQPHQRPIESRQPSTRQTNRIFNERLTLRKIMSKLAIKNNTQIITESVKLTETDIDKILNYTEHDRAFFTDIGISIDIQLAGNHIQIVEDTTQAEYKPVRLLFTISDDNVICSFENRMFRYESAMFKKLYRQSYTEGAHNVA